MTMVAMPRRSRSVPSAFLRRSNLSRYSDCCSDTLSEVSSFTSSGALHGALHGSLNGSLNGSLHSSLHGGLHGSLNSALKVIGKRCVLFDRPGRADIRRVAVWDTGLRQRSFSSSRTGSGRSSRAHRLMACGLSEHEVVDLFYRDITPEDYDLLLRLDELVPKRTACKDAVDRLQPRPPGERNHDVCGVCLVPFEADDDVLAVSCPAAHEFHRPCISKWLTECKNCCPVDHAELA
mmetsp:Transcript_148702/g.277145  ORF Transcript_148702/g.277145 Transcript_148702/m.277145 type:complete len:235 (-) Transcript_148702:22-726(-)